MASISQLLGGKKNQDISDVLAEAIFGKKSKPKKTTTPTAQKGSATVTDESQIPILRSIAANARISAKNSMALPGILQQTNIMQKNIAKLVRLQGANPTNKADAFFSSAKFRENAYESAFRKESGAGGSTSPKKEDGGGEKKGKTLTGFIDSLLGIFTSSFIKKMVVGGVLVAGLTKYFKDPVFKKQIDEMLTAFRRAFINDKGWELIKKGASDVGNVLILLGVALVGFKLALNYLAGRMWAAGAGMGRGMPMPNTPGRGGKPGKPGKPGAPAPRRMGTGIMGALTSLGLGFGASYLMSDSGGDSGATTTTPTGAEQVSNQSSGSNLGLLGGLAALQTVNTGIGGINMVSTVMSRKKIDGKDLVSKSTINKWINKIGKIRSKNWGARVLGKLRKRLMMSKLGRKILQKAIIFIAGLVAPGPGWVASIAAAAFFLWDVYWLYTILEEIIQDIEAEDAEAEGATSASRQANYDEEGQSNTSSRFKTALAAATAILPGPMGMATATSYWAGLAAGGNLADKLGMTAGQGAYKDINFAQVKDKIIAGEGTAKGGRNPYETVYGFGQFGSPSKKLTEMTIAEVQAFQSQLINATRGKVKGVDSNEGTGAVGAFQFTKETLATAAQAIYGQNWQKVKFTPEAQTAMAEYIFDISKGSNRRLSKRWAFFSDLDPDYSSLRAQGASGGSVPYLSQIQVPPPAPPVPAPAKNKTTPSVDGNIFKAPVAANLGKSGAPATNYVVIDQSQTTVGAQSQSAASPAAQTMPSVYNPEQFNLSNIMRASAM
jgi:hypothetical protein